MDNGETKQAKYYMVPVAELIPYARNARTHSDEQVAQIAASIKEFGFLTPIVVAKDNTILCGHGRYYAAQKLGLKEIPAVKEEYLTEAQRRAYILADNKLALNAGWDNAMLAVEISDLKDQAFDLDLLGFTGDELTSILDDTKDKEGEEDEFDVDGELGKPNFSKPGDIWLLGRHKIICGDSTKPEVYATLLGDTKVNLVCSDPPYFLDIENKSGKITNDNLNDEDGYKFLLAAFTNFHDSMARDSSIYIFYATTKARVYHDAYEDAGFRVSAGLVWKKSSISGFNRTDWKYNHEPIIWGWKKDGVHHWYGDHKQATCFEFDRIKDSAKEGCGHPSSKPLPLIVHLIKNCTQTNALVLDGFLGSASTLIACEQINRTCFGVELESKYIDVAVKRYINYKEGNSDDVFLIRDGVTIPFAEVEMPEDENSDN